MRTTIPGIVLLLAGCASTPPPDAVKDLAPNGTLRAAINVGNAVLAQRGREAGARYVRDFVEDVNASGFVAEALERHKQTAAVAPPGDAK